MTDSEKEIDLSQYTQASKFWIPDKNHLWVGATVFTPPGNKGVTVKTDDGHFLVISSLGNKGVQIATEEGEKAEKYKVFELPPKNPDFLEGCADLTTLSYLHEPAVLHNLKVRYIKDEIYTFTGAILIALNPWKPVPALYNDEVMRKYSDGKEDNVAPHVYYVAQTAYSTLRETGQNQTILVSGESGAGKTENCKILMRFLAMTTGDAKAVGEIESRVLDSNPILEAFGNARTLRNDNSSRFGKFMEIHFSEKGQIIGAKIETYLLEKSRLVRLGPGDRNFHILYQICAGLSPDEKLDFKLGNAESYHYLNQSDVFTIQGRSEADEFKITRAAMDTMGISAREQEGIFRVVAAILHLGNVVFESTKQDGAVVSGTSAQELEITSDLLKVTLPALTAALTSRKIFAGGEYLTQALRSDQANDSRDALAKALYSRLFLWLVSRINSSIHLDSNADRFIGLLDIFGFEYFEENSFEQLCINYANEKIQQLFNSHIFKMEQKEYAKEQIKWTYVEFKDNQAVLDLIEDKPDGLLSILDEECMIPKGTDEGFVQKLRTRIKSDLLTKNRFSEQGFLIKHFAGDVSYDSYQFLEKNKDPLHPDLVPCIQASKCPFTKALFPSSMFYQEMGRKDSEKKERAKVSRPGKPEVGGGGGTKIFQVTVGTQFKEALNNLANKIWETTPYFVRCIKPNSIKRPRVFDNTEVSVQLNCGGVYEAIRIMRDMYPSRISHEEFYRRFTTHEWKCIVRASKKASVFVPLAGNNFSDFEGLRLSCISLCNALGLNEDQFQVGRSKVFFRTGILAQQEDRLHRYIFNSASNIRKTYLGWVARRRYKEMRKAAKTIQYNARSYLAKKKVKHMRRNKAARRIQAAWRKTQRISGFRKVVYQVTKDHYLKKRMIEIEAKRENCALMIQTYFRAHSRFKKFANFRKAITRLQAAFRGGKVRKTNKINRALNIVEDKKRLEKEVKDLKQRVALLEGNLEDRTKKVAELEEENGNVSAELATTKDQLSSVKAARKKLEEKANSLSTDLNETRTKLEEETKLKNEAIEKFTTLQAEHQALVLLREGLENKIHGLELELRTTKEQFQSEKSRLEGEVSYLRTEIETELKEKSKVSDSLMLEKGTVESMAAIIVTLKLGLKKLSRQIRHERENTKLHMASLRSTIERETFLELETLKKAMMHQWNVQKGLREEKAELENDINELEKRLESVVQDLIAIEKELAEETESHWRTNDAKKALEKQLQTASQLFSALEVKKERLEKELAEKNQDLAELKIARNQGPQKASAPLPDSRKYSVLETPGIIAARKRQNQPIGVVNKLKSSTEASLELNKITKTGWLTKDRKKGDDDKRKSKWERRYFVLRPTSAQYFEDAECKKLKGDIPLDACFVQEDPVSAGPSTSHEPNLKLVTGGRTLYFMADTASETESWISAIKTNIALNSYLKKSIMTHSRIDPRVTDFACNYQSQEIIFMDNEWLSLEAIVAMQQPLRDCHCTTLSLEGCELDDLHIQVLATAIAENRTIKTLNLARNSITDAGALGLRKSKTITTISVSGNMIKAEGAGHLAAVLLGRKNVTRLSIDKNPIGDAGVVAFAKAIGNKDLKYPVVNFTSTDMGDQGCLAVAEMLKANPNVVDVFLSHNKITTKGASELAKILEKVTNIQCIDVSSNVIDEKGILALAKMLEHNSKILSVSIGGNRLTSGKSMADILSVASADSKLVFPLLAFERQAAGF